MNAAQVDCSPQLFCYKHYSVSSSPFAPCIGRKSTGVMCFMVWIYFLLHFVVHILMCHVSCSTSSLCLFSPHLCSISQSLPVYLSLWFLLAPHWFVCLTHLSASPVLYLFHFLLVDFCCDCFFIFGLPFAFLLYFCLYWNISFIKARFYFQLLSGPHHFITDNVQGQAGGRHLLFSYSAFIWFIDALVNKTV